MKKTNIFFKLGCICIILALVLFINNYQNDKKVEKSTNDIYEKLIKVQSENNEKTKFTNPKREMPTKEINNNFYIGEINIPRLSLKLPVLNDWSEENLTIAPARFKGSIYQNNMIIMAHNYRSHFGKIHNLEMGDMVEFKDTENTIFLYKVKEVELLKEEELSKLLNKKSDLTLFTCDLSGRNRVVVRCEKVNNTKR